MRACVCVSTGQRASEYGPVVVGSDGRAGSLSDSQIRVEAGKVERALGFSHRSAGQHASTQIGR